MDEMATLTQWLRELIAAQAWLVWAQPYVARAPDWVLLAAPALVVLLLAWVLFRPRGKSRAERARSSRGTDVPVTPTSRPPAAPKAEATLPNARAPGIPADSDDNRAVRVFISSTFIDMEGERNVLVKQTFPALRTKFRARGVEFLEIDLRWGVTEEEVQSGKTLPICLAEVDRCRPYFVGLLGERYGSLLSQDKLTPELQEFFPVLREGVGRSLTEIEIMQGVLRNRESASRALFFQRDPAWLKTLSAQERAQYETGDDADRAKLADLKARIRASGARIIDYARPEDIGPAVEAALSEQIEARFPEAEVPDAFTQTLRLHGAYARERRGLHIGAEPYLAALDQWMAKSDAPPLLITGASGGGKSTLVANWLHAWRGAHPNDIVFEHYLGASPDSADPMLLMRRLWEHLNRATGESVELPAGNVDLVDLSAALSTRITQANLHADRQGVQIIFALDGLDKLSADQDLHWLPRVLPTQVKLLASSLDGEAKSEALARGWASVEVTPLTAAECHLFVKHTLAHWGKGASPKHVEAILHHTLAGTPLFLKTLLDELRYSATHERLEERLAFYLLASDLADLFARILARLEVDCGQEFMSRALSLVWASRAGLEEAEIIAITGAAPLTWAVLRNGLGDAFRNQNGRLTFSHDFLRQAVGKRYLSSEGSHKGFHRLLAAHFDKRVEEYLARNERWSAETPLTTVLAPVSRQMEEVPFQLRAAEEWDLLTKWLEDFNHFRWFRIFQRGDAEWLDHWLPLMARGYDLQSRLCPLFEEVFGEGSEKANLALATNFLRFLKFAGNLGRGAERLARSAAAAAERLRGPAHQDTFLMWNWVGTIVAEKGDLDEAQRIQERGLEMAMQHFGANDPVTIDCMSALAGTLHRRGESALALRMHKLALEGRERLFGPDHPSTLNSMSWVAACQLDSGGDPEAAIQLLRTVVERRERILGPNHSETLDAADNLVTALHKGGDSAAAQELQERTLAIRTRLFGPNHPKPIASMENLAVMLGADTRHPEAKELLDRVVAAETQLHGADHPSTLTSKRQLAGALRAVGDLVGARALQEKVLEDTIRVLGPEHPDTLASLDSLAGTLEVIGDFSAACQIQRRSFEVKARLLGSGHRDTLATMNDLAVSLLEIGEIDEAKRMLEQVVEARTRALGPDDTSTLTSMNNLAGALSAAGDFEAARKVQEEALARMTRTFGPDHQTTLTTMNNLALTLSECGDEVGAHNLKVRVLDGLVRAVGAEHPSTLVAMCNLAASLHALGDSEQAASLLERAHGSMVTVLGADHPRTRMAASNLAAVRRGGTEAHHRARRDRDDVSLRRGGVEVERNAPGPAVGAHGSISNPNNEATLAGNHTSAEALVDRFEEKSGSVRIVVLSVKSLGFSEEATTAEILGADEDVDEQGRPAPYSKGRAIIFGLALWEPKVAMQAAPELDIPIGETWYFGMRPIPGPDGVPAIFVLRHSAKGKGLDGIRARPKDKWSPSCKFVFCAH